jgi:hypothetical protein
MTAQGLLVKGTHGEEYLLTTELNRGTCTHRLVVLKKVNDQWTSVEAVEAVACREGLIGAFVGFVVDLCRVLNSAHPQQASEIVPGQRLSPGGLHDAEPALSPQGRN